MLCAKQKLKNLDQDYEQLTERYRVRFLSFSLVKSIFLFLSKIYLKWLFNWCCSNLYLEGSYSQRHLCILILHWLINLHGNNGIQTNCGMFLYFSQKNQLMIFSFYLKRKTNFISLG